MEINYLVEKSESLADMANSINSTLSTGGEIRTDFCSGCSYHYYSWWPHSCSSENKLEKAYKVVRALMAAKIVKIDTLDKFFKVMDEIQKVI